MRGAKVLLCSERNKCAKIQILGGLISVYFIFKIKNGIVQIAAIPKKIEIAQIPVT